MDLFDAIAQRASVRAFAPVTIPDADLERIVDAGRRAPSGCNRQPTEFVIITDPALIRQLGEVQGCMGAASAAIGVVVDEELTQYWKEDAAAAIENMLLAATALGYASLWVEGYVLGMEDHVRELLGAPANRRVLAVLPLGHAADRVTQAAKKPLATVTHRNRYGTPWA